MTPDATESPTKTGYKRYFGLNLAQLLADKIAAVSSTFDADAFMAAAGRADLHEQQLLGRVNLLATLLRQHLPDDYPTALDMHRRIYGPENPNETGMFTFGYWLWPVGSFIGTYGLNHYELSLFAIHDLTKRHTGEYAIRPFIRAHPERTVNHLQAWAHSPSVHVRRLASEGIRPRLPWSQKLTIFIDQPAPVFEILETLKDDTSRFVQKSIANTLNDYLKDNRARAIEVLQRWAMDATLQRRWTIRHALRNELKRQRDDALTILEHARSIG